MTYDNIECHKKPGLHRFPEKYIFGKTTGKGGGGSQIDPSPAFLGLNQIRDTVL